MTLDARIRLARLGHRCCGLRIIDAPARFQTVNDRGFAARPDRLPLHVEALRGPPGKPLSLPVPARALLTCSCGDRMQERLRRIFGHVERSRRVRVGFEFRECGWILSKMRLKRRYSRAVSGMVRKKCRQLMDIRALKSLKEPHQTPGIVTGCCAYVGASHIGF